MKPPPPNPNPLTGVAELVSTWTTQWQTPGVSIAIVDPYFGPAESGVVLPFGYASLAGAQPLVAANTVFELGSVTKLFTSLLLALANGNGVSLSDPVANHLPGLNITGGFGNVTLEQLATHTSGLVDGPDVPTHPSTELFHNEPPSTDLITYWNTVTPGAHCWKYSNIGFVTLGFAVTQMFGSKYAWAYTDLLADLITTPLGMSTTGARIQKSWPSVADGYNWTPTSGNVRAGTATDLKSSGADMLGFLLAQLGMRALPDPLMTAIRLTQTLQGTYPQCPPDSSQPAMPMGLGWQMPPGWAKLTDYYYKNGASSLGGQSCVIELFRDVRYGIVVLTNQDVADPSKIQPVPNIPAPSPSALARAILELLHPEIGSPTG